MLEPQPGVVEAAVERVEHGRRSRCAAASNSKPSRSSAATAAVGHRARRRVHVDGAHEHGVRHVSAVRAHTGRVTTEIERKFLVADVPAADVARRRRAAPPGLPRRRGRRRDADPHHAGRRLVHRQGRPRRAPGPRSSCRSTATRPSRCGRTPPDGGWRRSATRCPSTAVVAEVDRYGGELDGLWTVEVEFDDEAAAEAFAPPAWFGPELTTHRGGRTARWPATDGPAEPARGRAPAAALRGCRESAATTSARRRGSLRCSPCPQAPNGSSSSSWSCWCSAVRSCRSWPRTSARRRRSSRTGSPRGRRSPTPRRPRRSWPPSSPPPARKPPTPRPHAAAARTEAASTPPSDPATT